MGRKQVSVGGSATEYVDAVALLDAVTGSPASIAPAADVYKPQSAVAITTETAIWTPASGKKFRLLGFLLVTSLAGNIVLKDGIGGTTILIIPSPAATVGTPTFVNLGVGITSGAANNALTATGPSGATLSGFVMGNEV